MTSLTAPTFVPPGNWIPTPPSEDWTHVFVAGDFVARARVTHRGERLRLQVAPDLAVEVQTGDVAYFRQRPFDIPPMQRVLN
jgi:hypothetical protein